MVRKCPDGFLQNHINTRVFPDANKYVDGVSFNENFEAIRVSSVTIAALLHVMDEGELMAKDNNDNGATTTMTTTMTMASNNNEAI